MLLLRRWCCFIAWKNISRKRTSWVECVSDVSLLRTSVNNIDVKNCFRIEASFSISPSDVRRFVRYTYRYKYYISTVVCTCVNYVAVLSARDLNIFFAFRLSLISLLAIRLYRVASSPFYYVISLHIIGFIFISRITFFVWMHVMFIACFLVEWMHLMNNVRFAIVLIFVCLFCVCWR